LFWGAGDLPGGFFFFGGIATSKWERGGGSIVQVRILAFVTFRGAVLYNKNDCIIKSILTHKFNDAIMLGGKFLFERFYNPSLTQS